MHGMRIVIYCDRFALTRRLYRDIRRRLRQALENGLNRVSRVVVRLSGVDGQRAQRCRVEVQMGLRLALVAEAVDADARVALDQCLRGFDGWLPDG
jgi:hypothetical protein